MYIPTSWSPTLQIIKVKGGTVQVSTLTRAIKSFAQGLETNVRFGIFTVPSPANHGRTSTPSPHRYKLRASSMGPQRISESRCDFLRELFGGDTAVLCDWPSLSARLTSHPPNHDHKLDTPAVQSVEVISSCELRPLISLLHHAPPVNNTLVDTNF